MKRIKVLKREHYLIEKTSKDKILEELFKHPDIEYSLTDLAKEARVPKSYIGKILQEFYEFGIIKIIKLTKIWRIMANTQNSLFVRNKIIFNLNYIYQIGLVEFLNDLYNNPKTIILFGSFRNGEDISESDVDIAIETEEVKNKYQVLLLRELIVGTKEHLEYITNIENNINRKIQIHIFNRQNIDINVFNNIANGIKLSGFLEVKP